MLQTVFNTAVVVALLLLPGGVTSAGVVQPGTENNAAKVAALQTESGCTTSSCHASDKAFGYGIGGTRLTQPLDQPVTIDLMTAEPDVGGHAQNLVNPVVHQLHRPRPGAAVRWWRDPATGIVHVAPYP